MGDQTRREFLELALMLGGTLALPPALRAGAEPGRATDNGVAAAARPAGAAGAADGAVPCQLAIARWQTAGAAGDENRRTALALEPQVASRLTETSLAMLGGMSRFVGRGDIVWIKPNIAWNRRPELGATTHPEVVSTLVRLCLEAGAKKVKVGDHTCHDPRQSYVTSGIAAAASAAGAEVVYLDDNRYRQMEIGGRRIKRWLLYPEIIESDLVINVPVAKHHGLSMASVCMKNYMGVIGGQVSAWHQGLPDCLCDITAFMKPRLCVVDAVRALVRHGPTGGNPADVDAPLAVAAGSDPVALDAWGAELLGLHPEQVRTIVAGQQAGLGTADYRSLPLREQHVS
jgi:uncharacterized protein (DUF362 family)